MTTPRSDAGTDNNFKNSLIAVSSTDGKAIVPLEADPTNGALLVEVVSGGSGGGSDVQYTDGAAAVTHPIGTIPVFNNAGTITAVSAANPLPVNASVTVTGVATAVKQSDGSQKTQIVDGSGNVIASTSNALNTSTNITNSSLPVTGTVTANAGTNLNTSTLALETGGNLAAIKADVDKIPSQGQALAAASTPVVLPAAQITTLTPPTTITATQGTPAAITAGWPVIGGELADTTGTFTNATQTTSVTSNSFDGYSTVIVSINGTYGTATGVFEISDDGGTTWYSVNAARTDGTSIETGYTSLTNTNRMWTLSVSGADEFRVRSTAVASGTVNVRLSIESMPTPEAASVSAYQATAANLNATVVGTVTSNIGTTNGLALDATLTGGNQQVQGNVASAATDSGNPVKVGAKYLATKPTFTDGQRGDLQIGTRGSVAVSLFVADSNTAQSFMADNANAVAASATANKMVIVARDTVFNGMTWDLTPGDATNGVYVNVKNAVPGTGATNLGKAEDAAHTSGDTGVMALGVRNDTLADTTNTNADYAQLSTDIKGRVITAGAPRSLKGMAQVSVSNTTTETSILAATASTFHDVYGIILANTGASTTKVSIRDATAGTVRMIIEVPTLETRGFMLPVDSAVAQSAVNTAWTVQCGTATTALEVTLLYVSMV